MNYYINKSTTNLIIFIFLLSITLVVGCKKDETPPEPEPDPVTYKSYVSHELVLSYTSEAITVLFQFLQISYPEISALTAMVEYDVAVYNVTYKTIFQDEEIEVSGLVCIPITEGKSLPIISFQNGTNTSHAEAPTKDLNSLMFKYLHTTASIGYIMLIPDYIGFGKSEQFMHPYLHKESTVLSVENLIEATGEMITAELIKADWNKNVYLMGYSQGGWSTLCTHRDIIDKSDLTYSVTATACGAGPYDLSVVQNFMFESRTYPQPVYMAYSAVSYKELGLITNPLTDYFNEPYATPLPSYFNGQFSNGEINEKLNDTVTVLMAEPFLNGMNTDAKYEDLRTAMNNNSVYGWNTVQPIRIYHGTSDNYVPPTTSEQVFQEFVSAGAADNVSYIPLAGLTHETGAIPMIFDALMWFTDMEYGISVKADKETTYLTIDASKPQMIME